MKSPAVIMKQNYADFHGKESGLMINPPHPHLGASPDANPFVSVMAKGAWKSSVLPA